MKTSVQRADDPRGPVPGLFVLAMGKGGAFELNYSSDIDLIVFFEPAVVPTTDKDDLTTLFVRLTRRMIAILVAGGTALVLSLLLTPLFIRYLVHKQYGQFIRQDGPTAHFTKRGTPTMGGVIILLGTSLSTGLLRLWR